MKEKRFTFITYLPLRGIHTFSQPIDTHIHLEVFYFKKFCITYDACATERDGSVLLIEKSHVIVKKFTS